VWGPPNLRRMAKQAARAGATGSGLTHVGCDVGSVDAEGALVMILVFVLVAGVYVVAKLIARHLRERHHRLNANGARRKLPSGGFSTGRIGTIVIGDQKPSPIGDTAAVAYAVKLTQRGRTMLYDGATVGFQVLLEDDSRVVIPAGTCSIDLGDAPKVSAESYLAQVDPLRQPGEEFDPFLHDRAVGRTLKIGDCVEVLGRLIEEPAGGGGTYREAPRTVLVPVGVPALRAR
jgi:hypothetical protein